jgi:hypothetical protein
MKKLVILLIFLLSVAYCFGQTQSPPSERPALGHGAFPVKVNKTLDSSKLKAGDSVELETIGAFKMPDGTLVPKGSRLFGHVVTAKAKSKGDPASELVLAFEKLNVADGKQLSLNGSVQAVFPPPDEVDPGMPGSSGMQKGAGAGTMPDASYHPGGVKTGVADASQNGEPVLDPKSAGVQGMHDLKLEDGALSSKGKQVKLGGGVRIVVRAEFLEYSPQS